MFTIYTIQSSTGQQGCANGQTNEALCWGNIRTNNHQKCAREAREQDKELDWEEQLTLAEKNGEELQKDKRKYLLFSEVSIGSDDISSPSARVDRWI